MDNIIKELNNLYEKGSYDGLLFHFNDSIESLLILNICLNTNKKIHILSDSEIKQNNVINHKVLSDEFDIISSLIRISNENNLMVISCYDLIALNILKPWKRFGFVFDFSPLSNLTRSDILTLVKEQSINIENNIFGYYNINIEGLKYEDLVWSYEVNKRYNIFDSDIDPSKKQFWHSLTMNQKIIIAKVYNHVKANIKR